MADAWFLGTSFAFPAIVFSVLNVSVLVASWFSIRYRISSSVLHAFALLKMFPKHSSYLDGLMLPYFALFEQRGSPLGSCFYSHCRSLLKLRCFVLHSLLDACLCLYTQANYSANLLCTSLLLSDILQRSLLDRAQAWFDAAVKRVSIFSSRR